MISTPLRTATRPRDFVAVTGPDAATYLQRMVSNDVESLAPGESCEALLLTAKARVIAPMTVLRRAEQDFLLLTEPGLGVRLRQELLRFRFAARCAVEPEEHAATLVLGADGPPGSARNSELGLPAHELIDGDAPAGALAITADELERLRILAGSPRFGRELDARVMPAEAGLEERAISFTKGCYPGQEPVARLHYRGHPNRGLRTLELEGAEPPVYDAELTYEGKAVGRVTSAIAEDDRVLALAYVRREVPADAELACGPRTARQLHSASPRP